MAVNIVTDKELQDMIMAAASGAKPKDKQESSAPIAKQGETNVKIVHPDGAETDAKGTFGSPKLFLAPPCEVGVSAGLTINLGNYQSARVDVTVKIPCAHTELDKVFAFGKEWVDAKIQSLAAQYTK